MITLFQIELTKIGKINTRMITYLLPSIYIARGGMKWLGATLFAVLLIPAFSQEVAGDWAPWVDPVNASALTVLSGLREAPETLRLEQRVIQAYEKREMESLTTLLRKHPPAEPAGQVIAACLATSISYSKTRMDDLVALFLASLDWPNDRYDEEPRGHLTSDTFRYRLGCIILGLLGKGGLSEDPTAQRLGSHPEEWLRAHLAAQVKVRKGTHAVLENTRGQNLPSSDVNDFASEPRQTALKSVTQAPKEEPLSPKPWPVVILVGLAALGLVWLLLKRRKV